MVEKMVVHHLQKKGLTPDELFDFYCEELDNAKVNITFLNKKTGAIIHGPSEKIAKMYEQLLAALVEMI